MIILTITGIVYISLFTLDIIRMCSAQVDNSYEMSLRILAILFYIFLLWYIPYVTLCAFKVLYEEKMSDITRNLSKNFFTEIYYKFQNSNDAIIVDIVKKEPCKFYAKLDEDQDDNIIIIAKNKSEEEVFRTVTRNPKYFLSNFSLTEN